jgi:Methyltransferase domain
VPGLFGWNGRKTDGPAVAPAPGRPVSGTVTTSKVFPRFLAVVARRTDPVLLDLGPVVGANVSFLGDRLACKIHVNDLYTEVEAHARRGDHEALAQALAACLPQEPEAFDGILCWDLFDYLDRSTGQAVAARLVALLRPGGALYGLFGTTAAELTHYTRFVIEGEDTLRQRTYPATAGRRNVLLTRDINKLFDGLSVTESVLLKTSTRETLFRKP